MATARITHTYPDGSSDECVVQLESSYPDAVDEAVAQVKRLFRAVCEDTEAEDE